MDLSDDQVRQACLELKTWMEKYEVNLEVEFSLEDWTIRAESFTSTASKYCARILPTRIQYMNLAGAEDGK